MSVKEQERHRLAKTPTSKQILLTHVSISQKSLPKCIPPAALSPTASDVDHKPTILEDECAFAKPKTKSNGMEFNRVNCIVWVLHESARSFSLAMQTHELVRTGPPLAMAWNGVDVHAWYKHIAYQVYT